MYYERWKHLQGPSPYRWRSGIKHDCAVIMELVANERGFKNKLGDRLDLVALARELGSEDTIQKHIAANSFINPNHQQLRLF